ncbi:fibronectin type III domain-containing protein [Turneriella parva]|nr:fibronectin type III domain-containing protein [Turneriella parva]
MTHLAAYGVRYCTPMRAAHSIQIFGFLFLLALPALGDIYAERLNAAPLTGGGEFEFYFISPEKKVEADAHVRRIAELGAERDRLRDDIKRAETELAALDARAPKKKQTRLEWSPVEGAAAYSVKVFDASKKLLDTRQIDENYVLLDLDPGEYFFQVAAVTKFKTGTYSRLSPFRATRPKPSEEHLEAEENLALLKEKLVIADKLRADHHAALKADAVSSASAQSAAADLTPPAGAAFYVAVEKKGGEQRYSLIHAIPGRSASVAEASRSGNAVSAESSFWWGADLVAGIQDTNLDFFRVSLGAAAFVRYDKPFFRYFYPQLKLTAAYSPSKTNVYDAMVFTNLYPGVYYPITLGKGFSVFVSLSTGPNVFFVLSSAASGSVLQWGVMPATELHYALSDRTSLYTGVGINFTFDPQGVLKFVPIYFGLTRRF